MTPIIRTAAPDDIPRLVALLHADAQARQAANPGLWALAEDDAARIQTDLTRALTAEAQPVRQFWQVAEVDGDIVGAVHAMRLPVPPIYAGSFGEPGLILPDCATDPQAPVGTADALVAAAEAALVQDGARILLSAWTTGSEWQGAYETRGYAPLTLYLSRAATADRAMPPTIRPATQADIPGIVARSAENRAVLFRIDPFWAIHADADARFEAWMRRSLTLTDRDMFVAGPAEAPSGYVIAQPASRLHFPPAHESAGVGVIDDFYHPDLADPDRLAPDAGEGLALLHAAEAAFAKRGMRAVFVVCPARWHSRRALLEGAGYATAMVWGIKR